MPSFTNLKQIIMYLTRLISILAFIQLCLAFGSTHQHLNYKTGSTCSLVDGTQKHPGSINLSLRLLHTSNRHGEHELKVPFLIFKYSEILHLANVPTLEDYATEYKKAKFLLYDRAVDFKTSKFDLLRYRNFKVSKSDVYTDYLVRDKVDKKFDLTFDVTTKGVYCVYIAPPLDANITKISVPVTFNSAHGYLPFVEYVSYIQQASLLIVGGALFGYLLKLVLSKDLDSISIISKSVLFYVFAPFLVLTLVRVVIGLLANNINFGKVGYRILAFISNWLSLSYNAVLSYFTLIFAMGYGVIYYHKVSSRNYQVLRDKKVEYWRLSLGLLVAHIILGTIDLVSFRGNPFVINTARYVGDVIGKSTTLSAISSSAHSLSATITSQTPLSGILPLVWFVLTIYHFFRTKKALKLITTDNVVVSSFKKSFWAIYLLPFVVSFLLFIALAALSVKPIRDLSKQKDFLDNVDRPDLRALALTALTIESSLSFTKLFAAQWIGSLSFLAVVVYVFYVWFDYDNILIVGNEVVADEAVL